jgi:hypothetical protein
MVRVLVLLMLIPLVAGCHKVKIGGSGAASVAPVAAGTPAEMKPAAITAAQKNEEFKFTVAWPAKPKESGSKGIYSGIINPTGILNGTFYTVTVYNPLIALDGKTVPATTEEYAKQMTFGSGHTLTTTRTVTVGRAKIPAIEQHYTQVISPRSDRRRHFIHNGRGYSVGIFSYQENGLTSPTAEAFFDSFDVLD